MSTLGECPVCGVPLERVPNDSANRHMCPNADCWFHSNPVPEDVAAVLRCTTKLYPDQKRCETCRHGGLRSRLEPCASCEANLWQHWSPK